jgi:predicted O-methyltransferase YrrM
MVRQDRLVNELIERAEGLARELGFTRSCIPEVGRLLHVLTPGRTRVGEIGTGTGFGAAWIIAALDEDASLVTVEFDEERAAAAAHLFAGLQNVRVLHGDWHRVMPREAPFDLLFYDGGGKQNPERDGQQVVDLLAPGGLVVMDDLTPGRPGPDPVRGFWLRHSELVGTEILTTPTTAAILAAKR